VEGGLDLILTDIAMPGDMDQGHTRTEFQLGFIQVSFQDMELWRVLHDSIVPYPAVLRLA
jgi:hypothetical protein